MYPFPHQVGIWGIWALNPKKTGGGPKRPPPLDIFRENSVTQKYRAATFHDFFLSSLAQLLRPNLRRQGTRFRSYAIFCKCMSDPKLLKNVISCTNQMQILFLAKIHKYIIIFTFNWIKSINFMFFVIGIMSPMISIEKTMKNKKLKNKEIHNKIFKQ